MRRPRRQVACACGCGQMIETPDKYCRERTFVKGHWGRIGKKGKYLPHLEEANLKKRIKHVFIDDVEGKVCRECKEWKPLSEYGNLKDNWDKLSRRCKQCLSNRALRYYYRHRDRINAERKTEEYKVWFREYQSQWSKKRIAKDLNYKLKRKLRYYLWRGLKGLRKCNSAIDLIGCTIDELKVYLEGRFQEGMTWDNYGQPGWELDHIIPVSSFDLTDIEQRKQCFHYTNLQPLWGSDNWRKSNKIIPMGEENAS
ncbi:MAG: hypothetical protein ACXABY_27125 [Candidatus Thorarchaeota archaeon]|jgi:hypothetical protein